MVARVNRLSRAGLGDAIKLVERIHEAGATVAFAELGNIDPRSAQGEMVVNLWLLIARMQWHEYAEKFDADKKRAVVEKGWFVGPNAARIRETRASRRPAGCPTLDDPSLEVMQEAFKRAVADLTVRRGREPLPERVQLELAA